VSSVDFPARLVPEAVDGEQGGGFLPAADGGEAPAQWVVLEERRRDGARRLEALLRRAGAPVRLGALGRRWAAGGGGSGGIFGGEAEGAAYFVCWQAGTALFPAPHRLSDFRLKPAVLSRPHTQD
jgi:hypothetical protein